MRMPCNTAHLSFTLLVYGFFLPPCLLVTFKVWHFHDPVLMITLALFLAPLCAVVLLVCHGSREQELPQEALQYSSQTTPDPDMATWLTDILEPHERIRYCARIQRDAVNELVKKTGAALLLAGPTGTVCWVWLLEWQTFGRTVLQLGIPLWFLFFFALMLRYAWANPAHEEPGCVVTDRNIIFKKRCDCSEGKTSRVCTVLSVIPLAQVQNVSVGANWGYWQQNIGVVRVLCADPATIRRIVHADFPLHPEDYRKVALCPGPLHYVQHPDTLKQHIESAARWHAH